MSASSAGVDLTGLIAEAPGCLDTLTEIAAALNSDGDFLKGILTAITPVPEDPKPMKIVVTGVGSYNNYFSFSKILNGMLTDLGDFELISGGEYSGPDLMLNTFAGEHGILSRKIQPEWDDITVQDAVVKHNLRMRKYNANAQFDRNRKLAQQADHAIVFWDGKCSVIKHLIDCLRENCVPFNVLLVDDDYSPVSEATLRSLIV